MDEAFGFLVVFKKSVIITLWIQQTKMLIVQRAIRESIIFAWEVAEEYQKSRAFARPLIVRIIITN